MKVEYDLSEVTLTVKDGKVTIEMEDPPFEVEEYGPVEEYLCHHGDPSEDARKGQRVRLMRLLSNDFFCVAWPDGRVFCDNAGWFNAHFCKVAGSIGET